MTPKQLTIVTWSGLIVACFFAGWVMYDHTGHSPKQTFSVSQRIPRAAPVTEVTPAAPQGKSKYAATPISDPKLAGYPYAAGWPVQLPGDIAATPVVADLLGDGHLEVIVPCRAAQDMSAGIAEGEPLLFAFRADGTELPRWPVALQENRPMKPGSNEWLSCPSVYRRSGKDHLALVGGHAGVVIVHGDGSILDLGGGSDWHSSIPLVDLDGDGIPDVAIGKYIANVDGHPVKDWPSSRQFLNGYAPCIGDAFGDGKLELFHLFYTDSEGTVRVGGFDSSGMPLVGWPKVGDDPSYLPPVMGDALGNGKMQIFASYGLNLYAWNPDSAAYPKTGPQSIFKAGYRAFCSSPSLADLDGDGKAEIILVEQQTRTIHAWHGDGSSLPNPSRVEPTTAESFRKLIRRFSSDQNDGAATDPNDGLIATLPPGGSIFGVSVVSLGDDPAVMDFFVGTYWVRRFRDGTTSIKNMVPQAADTCWVQPTVADVNGDGKADVIFGLSDGRLFVYETGLAYHAERMQWPTAQGNFQHTGAWHKPNSASEKQ